MIRRVSTLLHETESGLQYQQRQPLSDMPRSMLILLHGVGGNENDLVHLGESISNDTLVIYPRGPLETRNGGYGWFTVDFSGNEPRIDFDELVGSRNRLICMIRELQNTYRVRSKDTVVAGFSQGGIMSAAIGLHSPPAVKAFGCLAGRIPPELETTISRGKTIRDLHAYLAHGELDDKLPITWAERASNFLSEHSIGHVFNRYVSAHELSSAMKNDFITWVERALDGQAAVA